jgi:hypothetical protein
MPVLESAVAEETLKGTGAPAAEESKSSGDRSIGVDLLGTVPSKDVYNMVFGGGAPAATGKEVHCLLTLEYYGFIRWSKS